MWLYPYQPDAAAVCTLASVGAWSLDAGQRRTLPNRLISAHCMLLPQLS